MRVLICPDKFAGTLSASEVADAFASGWRAAAGDADVLKTLPLADGGPGMLDALEQALGGRRDRVEVRDPLGRPATASVLRVGHTAYVESADACGLHLLDPDERDPLRATSFGLGMLLTACVESGAREIVVGLGGSAVNDAGAGMHAAVGLTALDASGHALPYGGAALIDCAQLAGAPRLRQATLTAAVDVDNPLCGPHGASAVFGPQKGADRAAVALLDQALERYAQVLAGHLPGCPPNLAQLPGSGAAGGVAAGMFALGARGESGVALVSGSVGLLEQVAESDLVITGEGSFDGQSLNGKLVSGVAGAAAAHSTPCVVVAGRVEVDDAAASAAGINQTYSLSEHFGSASEAMSRPAEGLRELAAVVAGRWGRVG